MIMGKNLIAGEPVDATGATAGEKRLALCSYPTYPDTRAATRVRPARTSARA